MPSPPINISDVFVASGSEIGGNSMGGSLPVLEFELDL